MTQHRSEWLGGLLCILPLVAAAEGHGPLFGLATPTLGAGHLSSDTVAMGLTTEEGTGFMFREMLGYGLTEDVQVSVSFPLGRTGDKLMQMPATRVGTMMGAMGDVELSGLWRFQRYAPAVGVRRESTLIASLGAPTEDRRRGTRIGPSLHLGAVTGYVSRTIYWWLGGGYQYFDRRGQDQLGDLAYVSAVFAWRPPLFQADYPKPDWRIFLEVVGESADKDIVNGVENPHSGGKTILAGPSVLGLYGRWGVELGALFPVSQNLDGQGRVEERYRSKMTLTYWF